MDAESDLGLSAFQVLDATELCFLCFSFCTDTCRTIAPLWGAVPGSALPTGAQLPPSAALTPRALVWRSCSLGYFGGTREGALGLPCP